MKSFAQRLAEWRDSQQWTNASMAEYLARRLGIDVSPRTSEHWIQGRRPHRIWRKKIEQIMDEAQVQSGAGKSDDDKTAV